MPLWGIPDILLKARKLEQEKAQRKAAEAAAREEAERPSYSSQELADIRSLWTEPIREEQPSGKLVTKHIDAFFENRPSEHVKKLALFLVRGSYNVTNERANQLAEVIVRNRAYLQNGFFRDSVSMKILAGLQKFKAGAPERNVVNVILSKPDEFRDAFTDLIRSSPAKTGFSLTEEEMKPPKRRSGPTA
jgi:hypothetical protein